MNYIKHLTAFYEKVSSDFRLNPSHISLYMALFQFWNHNRFKNPISINRDQVMRYSKIGSAHTYYKCLYELHNYGYLDYKPSHNPLKGSLVYLCIFDTSTAQVLHKHSTSTAQALHPSINNINIIKNIKERGKNSHSKKTGLKIMEKKKTRSFMLKRKKVAVKKEKAEDVQVNTGLSTPPTLEQVLTFFKSENYPELEAQKFFNHFQSNGWKVAGKTPMNDWQAAARKWMLNATNFTKQAKTGPTTLNTNKKYNIPL